MTYLISYPRSGNTWVRYIVEFISKKPTNSLINPKPEKIIGAIADIDVTLNESNILIKTHSVNKKILDRQSAIFLIRNYKEIFIKHKRHALVGLDNQDELKKAYNTFVRGNHDFEKLSYANILYGYDKWTEPKLLIYYEDLITNYEKEITKIVKFLNINNKRVPEFFDNYKTHVSRGVKVYNDSGSLSETKGEKIIYHSNKLTNDMKKYMDSIMEKKHPDIFKKYLVRYKGL